jgi:hypothetical protein
MYVIMIRLKNDSARYVSEPDCEVESEDTTPAVAVGKRGLK